VEILSLRETLYRHCGKDLDLSKRIEKMLSDAAVDPAEPDSAILRKLRRESAELKPLLKRGIRLCRNGSTESRAELQRELERVKDFVYGQKNLAPLLDSFNQMGNYQFLRRRSALLKAAGGAHPSDIKAAYLDFFQSIQKAADIIDNALIRIRRILI
jgi:hypothetical protein